ncbi:DNA internalization-related competence protein ComEC/Rec2 [Salibacterium sp. K-3]
MKNDALHWVISGSAAIHFVVSGEIWTAGMAAALLAFLLLKKRALSAVLLLVVFACFAVRTEWAEHAHVSSFSGSETVIRGTIEDGAYRDGSLVRFTLRTDTGEMTSLRLRLHDESETQRTSSYSPGRFCTAQGTLTLPSSSSNFYAFDYRQYLKQQHTYWELDISSVEDIQCASGIQSLSYIFKAWRYEGIKRIERMFPENLKGISAALLFGERELLDAEIETDYQTLGLIHLLAVSGLHVGLLCGMVYYLLLHLGLTREKSEWMLLIMLPLYTVLAGAAPSVLRAVCMVAAYILWSKTGRKNVDPFFVLCIAALSFLFLHPYYLYHIGFQLSFLISGSLLLSRNILKRQSRWKAAVIVSMIAQLSGLPIILFHFYEFSFLSLVLNLVFVPFVSILVLPGVLLLFVFSFLPASVFSIVSSPFNMLIGLAHQILGIAGDWSEFTLIAGKPSLFITAALGAAVYFFFFRLDCRGAGKRLIFPVLVMSGVLVFQLLHPYLYPRGYITMLDVGQGDSIVIELPRRQEVYLIDAGGALDFPREEWEIREDPYDPGADIVVPFLKARGITALDKLIVTHGDIDHYGGAYAVMENMKVGEVLYGRGEEFKEAEKQFLRAVRKKGIPVLPAEKGGRWHAGGSSFQVLAPEGGEPPGNERSIVLRAELAKLNWLFTGDLEKEGEEQLLSAYPGLTADILKVGHHGSRTSSSPSFIEKLNLKAALISAGRCNRFGHPHEETLETLAEAGAAVYRTDRGGAVQIVYTEEKIENIRQAATHQPPECEQ